MKRSFLKQMLVLGAGAVLASQFGPVAAQSADKWPSRPIRIIVPFPAGGATDTIARTLGERMSAEIGQPFLIENRPGAGGMIGAQTAGHAAADGYTLLLATNSTLVTNKYLYAKLPYSPDQFELLGPVGITPLILLANPAVPAKTVPELVAYAKANPGKLTYASFGPGTTSHLAGEMLKQMAGIDIVHVPYKGASEAIPALIGGQVSIYFDTIITGMPHVKSGKLRALAITTARRSAAMADLPTVAEQGYPGFEIYPWYGLVALKGAPKESIDKLRVALAKSLQDPQLQQKLALTGTELTAGSIEDFASLIKSDTVKTEKIVRTAGITVQ